MKVARYRDYGGPENIEVAEQPDPTPAEGDLLVRVRAASVNPVDWKMAALVFPFNLAKPGLPYVPGFDIAGEVVEPAGPFAAGDRVMSRMPGRHGGASAELATVAPRFVARMPDAMSYEAAAAIPLAGLTALQGLENEARLPMHGAEEKRVLIIGASGGVGHFAVQIARAAGAHVTGVCSGPNEELVRSLGASETIDYTKESAFDKGGKYDVILDCVGGGDVGAFTAMLADRGSYVSALPDAGVFARQIASSVVGCRRVRGVLMHPDAEGLEFLAELHSAGKLAPFIERTFGLDGLADAHRASITGRTRGKLVIAIPS